MNYKYIMSGYASHQLVWQADTLTDSLLKKKVFFTSASIILPAFPLFIATFYERAFNLSIKNFNLAIYICIFSFSLLYFFPNSS